MTSRILGCRRGEAPGPTLIVVGGIHGNEPAGVHALSRVFETLDRRRPDLRGEFLGLAGNLEALGRGTRYLRADLNRAWRPDVLERLARRNGGLEGEDAELVELRAEIDAAVARARGTVHFLDLHTTSSRSAPFAVINDTLAARRFAGHFGVPIILGLEEHVEGTIADYAHRSGCVTMGFEAGRHDDPLSVDLHEATVWIALAAAGLVPPAVLGHFDRQRRRLREASRGLPRYLEIRDRHPLGRRGDFEMLPGFANFQPVDSGQLVAHDHAADVRARESSLLFMPLYQALGDDGFFLARPVHPFWLHLSGLLRRLGLGALVHWLPGVRRHPARPGAVLVDRRVARWYTNEAFHLLGYRRRPPENDHVVYVQRDREAVSRP